MVLHPHAMQRAQEEIDAAVGRYHPPSSIDVHKLPYIKAMAMETLRWRPIAPLSIPRAATHVNRRVLYDIWLI